MIEDYKTTLKNATTKRSSPRRGEEPRVGGIKKENIRTKELGMLKQTQNQKMRS
jgi:hypothetical protein